MDIQAIQRAEAGRAALSLERFAQLASALGVTLADLFTQETVPATLPGWSADEAQVIAVYRALPPDRRELVLPLLGVLRR